MSTPHDRLTPAAPVRQGAICMCATGGSCSSYAPGHALHLIQSRLVSATPAEWVDALVSTADTDGTIVLFTLDGAVIELWNGAGAAAALTVGSPVSFHPRYRVLNAGGQLFNALTR